MLMSPRPSQYHSSPVLLVQRKGEQSALSTTAAQVERHDEDMTQLTSRSSAEYPGAEQLDDSGEGGQERVQRRLAQNREAARKSRQRRKKYITDLESEVGTCMPLGKTQKHTLM